MAKTGRPELDIDPNQVEQYAMLGLSRRVIAALLGSSEQVIRRRFKKEYNLGRAKRLASIAKGQWDAAKSGNPAMLIWLGKNELGQIDKPEAKSGSAADKIIRVRSIKKPDANDPGH